MELADKLLRNDADIKSTDKLTHCFLYTPRTVGCQDMMRTKKSTDPLFPIYHRDDVVSG